MNVIEKMLSGKMDITDFMVIYHGDDELHKQIQALIPPEAILNPNHEYWHRCILRGGLECYDFNVRSLLFSHCGFGENERDRMEIFNTLRALYLWHHPNFRCTTKYEDECFFRIDIETWGYGGREVETLLEQIANETMAIRPKSLRKKEAKVLAQTIFHTEGRKKPHWIQEPDWPMGKHSPMEYVEEMRNGECVQFTFRDVDTEEIRIVKQFF